MPPTDLLDRLAALSPEQTVALLAALDGPQLPFTPLPGPQAAAYDSLADELLYGGAAGGGKSLMLIGCAATRHTRSLILRRQSTELDGLAADLVQMLGAGGFNKVDREHTGGGRSIKLGGCREPDDWRAYAGRARDFMGFDEAGEFLEEQVASLLAWLRSTDPHQRCRAIFGSNPPRGAEGAWLLKWFAPWLDPAYPRPAKAGALRWFVRTGGETRWVDGPGRYEFSGEHYTARSRTFIPARLADNPFLDRSDYRAGLENLPEPLRSQLLKGDFLAGREDDAWQLIPSDWIAAAQSRWEPGIPGPMSALGCDVAQGGADQTTLAARHGRWFAPLKAVPGRTTPDGIAVASLVFAELRDNAVVVIDAGGGWGTDAYGHLVKHLPDGHAIGFLGINPSTARSRNGIGFANKRAEAWWRFREALDPQTGDSVALPPDPELAADLAASRWKLAARGIQVEQKDEIRKRLGRSPDRGDAVVMAWAYGGGRPGDAALAGQLQMKYGQGAALELPGGEQPRTLSQAEIAELMHPPAPTTHYERRRRAR
ncbi:MAG: terminase [Stellaceae bacterium]